MINLGNFYIIHLMGVMNMIVGIDQTTADYGNEDYEFQFKQKVTLDNTVVYKTASPEDKIALISGTYYVKNPKPLRGFIKIAASEAECDIRMDTLWYVKAEDLIKIIKRGNKDGN